MVPGKQKPKSSRGGKRLSSGRKPLVETPECHWIVNAIRQTAESEDIKSLRLKYAVKKRNPRHVESHAELQQEYAKLQGAPISQRRQWMSEDAGTPLEEIRELREQPGFNQLIHVPAPNQFVMSIIYMRVAEEASKQYQKIITARKVKDCANAWMKFEKEISGAI